MKTLKVKNVNMIEKAGYRIVNMMVKNDHVLLMIKPVVQGKVIYIK